MKNKEQEMIYATCFAVTLLLFFVGAIIVAITSTGPLVLGTELNTNGVIEYLCLGKGCEALNQMQ